MSEYSTIDSPAHAGSVCRRSFLRASVAGGLTAPLIYAESLTAVGGAAEGCQYKLSAVEALTMFTDLLFRIQSDSFGKLNDKIELVAADCEQRYKSLCQLVEQLETELRKTNRAGQVQQMKVLTEIGCASAGQLVTSTSSQGEQAGLKALDTINREIVRAVEELLPEGETVLGTEATRVLRAILTEVHKSTASQQRMDDNQLARRESKDLITKGIQKVQGLIFSASSQILHADDGSSGSQNARARAVELLGQTRDQLEQLINDLKARQLYSEGSPGELLLALLDGTKQWVSNPASVGASPTSAYMRDEPRFITVKEFSPSAATVPFIGFSVNRVSDLLRECCPPDGLVHLSQIITAMTAVVGWKVVRTGVGLPPSYAAVRAKVWSALNILRLSCRPYGNHVPNPNKLADELTTMIML